jgi:sulfite reductase (NADPH) flavoprotein alpha-component
VAETGGPSHPLIPALPRQRREARPSGWQRAAGAFRLDWLRLRPTPPAPARELADGAATTRRASAPVLVAYATQTGVAEQLARDTVRRLEAAGVSARLADFETLTLPSLAGVERAMFLVSTTFDGDPPDMAESFSRDAMRHVADLAHLRYGLLALGDRAYDDFCAFGHHLHRWLRSSAAQTLFEPIDVDNEDDAALQRWQGCVAEVAQQWTSIPA